MQKRDVVAPSPLALCRRIGEARGELLIVIENALAEAGMALNFSQFLALKRLGEKGAMLPSELARTLRYSPGALTRLLDKLEHLGYLRRVPHPSDRRALHLELTAAGQQIRRRSVACAEAAAQDAFAELGVAERQQLDLLLQRLSASLSHDRGASRT